MDCSIDGQREKKGQSGSTAISLVKASDGWGKWLMYDVETWMNQNRSVDG